MNAPALSLPLPPSLTHSSSTCGTHLSVCLGDPMRCRLSLHSMPLHYSLEALPNAAPREGSGTESRDHPNATPTYLLAHTSTYWPGTKWAATRGVPTGRRASLLTLNSQSFRFGATPALKNWPFIALETCRGTGEETSYIMGCVLSGTHSSVWDDQQLQLAVHGNPLSP